MDGLVVMPRHKADDDDNALPCEIVYINRSISGGISGMSAGGIG